MVKKSKENLALQLKAFEDQSSVPTLLVRKIHREQMRMDFHATLPMMEREYIP